MNKRGTGAIKYFLAGFDSSYYFYLYLCRLNSTKMSQEYSYHKPVLLSESIEGLDIKPEGTYVDVTFGGGGHSREILRHLGSSGRLFAFDQDADAISNTIDDERFTLIQQNFKYVKRYLKFYGIISNNSAQIQTAFDLTKEQQAEVKKNVAQVKEAGGKFDTIAALIQSLTAEIEKIAVASQQTRTGAESTMDAIHRLHKVSHLIHQEATDVSALAEEQAAANTEIAASTGTLSTLAQELKKDVQKFKL